MKKLLLLFLLIPIVLFGTTKTVIDLTELTTAASNDYLIVWNTTTAATRRVSLVNLIHYLETTGMDSIEIINVVADSIDVDIVHIVTSIGFTAQTSTINDIQVGNLLDVAVDDTISAEIMFSDTCNIGGVSSPNLLDKSSAETISGKYTYSDTLDVTGEFALDGIVVTPTATEINNTVDSVSVFSARTLAHTDSITAHRTDIDINIDSVLAISSRSISNKDTLDTYIDGITYSKDLYDTGVTVEELDKCDGISATAYQTVMEMITFTETTGAGTYTGVITVPANSLILDIVWKNTKVWTATTTAVLNVGDADDADGYFANIDLKTEPAEVTPINPVSFSSFNSDAGGKAGGYAGLLKHSTSAQVITATAVTVGAAGDAGRSEMFVIYSSPTATEATKE